MKASPLLIGGIAAAALYLWTRKATASATTPAPVASSGQRYVNPVDAAFQLGATVVQGLRGFTPQTKANADARNRELIRSTEAGYYGDSAMWAGWTNGVAGTVNAQAALRKWDAYEVDAAAVAPNPVYTLQTDYEQNPWAMAAP